MFRSRTIELCPRPSANGMNGRQLRDLCSLGWLFVIAALSFIVLRSPVKSTGDFVYFYSIGRLLHEQPSHLYDYEAQQAEFDQSRPDLHGVLGPSPYPPFVALCFEPLASLPFLLAWRIWTGIAFGLYLAGLWLLLRAFLPEHRTAWPAIFCGALLFWPFLARTLASGQISAIGFFTMSLALAEQQKRRWFSSGLTLSLCLYKPTLLIWILALLIVASAWKTLAGFFAGAAILATVTTGVFGGVGIWRQYADMVLHLSSFQSVLIQSDYLDVLAVLRLGSGGALSGFTTIFCLGVGGLVILWAWHCSLTSAVEHRIALAWAITLPLSLLVNVYTPIYDSVLLIVSLIGTARLFQDLAPKWLIAGGLLLLVVSCCSTWIAGNCRIQPLSLLIAAISALQIWRCRHQTVVVNADSAVLGPKAAH